MKFDIAIIGGGPAGYTAAERAGANGLKAVLFEKKAIIKPKSNITTMLIISVLCLNFGEINAQIPINRSVPRNHSEPNFLSTSSENGQNSVSNMLFFFDSCQDLIPLFFH